MPSAVLLMDGGASVPRTSPVLVERPQGILGSADLLEVIGNVPPDTLFTSPGSGYPTLVEPERCEH